MAKVYGCTDPLAVNFAPAANQYDNSGVLGEQCRSARCGSATGPVPVCAAGWTGPRGGMCFKHDHVQQQSTSWTCTDDPATMGVDESVIVVFGTCASCASVDECAATAPDPVGPCNAPSNRLCVEATGLGGYVGPDCTNDRQTFRCGENVVGSAHGTSSNVVIDYDFTCVDPNPYWMGDFTCKYISNPHHELPSGDSETVTGVSPSELPSGDGV